MLFSALYFPFRNSLDPLDTLQRPVHGPWAPINDVTFVYLPSYLVYKFPSFLMHPRVNFINVIRTTFTLKGGNSQNFLSKFLIFFITLSCF